MSTNSTTQQGQMPSYAVRFALGMVVMVITLLLILTAVGPVLGNLMIDERCEALEESLDPFSTETAVPNCWLIQ
ncbi:hypothetical protein [Candidatus Leptofilum sp.]|uniref:hypothetical protein n=1 Tax=Candidatus Leptofilum sp. TaxID=3241576 RepID=UPI003B594BEF